MSISDLVTLAGLLTASIGGGAVFVVGLSSWLGNLWARRILQSEKGAFDARLEALRHEFGITCSTYEHHLDLILDYYATFYRHYRLCQRTAAVDAHRTEPDGEIVYTKDEFVVALRGFIAEWAAREGRMRLLLPANLLALHETAVEKFNQFKHAVHAFTPAEPMPRKKELVFREIEHVKIELEGGLREFLRTESLLK